MVEQLVHKTRAERQTLAYVAHRNGAYLISLLGEGTDDYTPDQLVDAAGSLRRAKRVARQMAAEIDGNGGPWRWSEERPGLWELTGTYTTEWDQWVDDGQDDEP